ncbi:MAG TPA: hypothetical protein VID27_20945, partial [Blastocatellia bacterium]
MMKAVPIILSLLCLLRLIPNKDTSGGALQSSVDIRGAITNIRKADSAQTNRGILGTIMVKGRKDDDTRFDQAALTITNDTRILARKGITHCSALFAYLEVGHEIEARVKEPVALSYPIQAVASEILVLNMPAIPPPGFAGDQPCYIFDISKCSALAQAAIRHKKLPVKQIHSCEDSGVTLDNGSTAAIVRISYGPGGDCPSGCIYRRYIGLFDKDSNLFDLPPTEEIGIEGGAWAHPPFNKLREPNSLIEGEVQKRYRIEAAFRKGRYGWVMKIESIELTHVTGGAKIT